MKLNKLEENLQKLEELEGNPILKGRMKVQLLNLRNFISKFSIHGYHIDLCCQVPKKACYRYSKSALAIAAPLSLLFEKFIN